GDLRDQRLAPFPDLVADVHHGAARGADSGRIGGALGARGHLRRPAPRSHQARRLPGARVSEELYERAVAAANRAYAPYSNYLVGAAVKARDGRVFEGVNVENAAYPLGGCAEYGADPSGVGDG